MLRRRFILRVADSVCVGCGHGLNEKFEGSVVISEMKREEEVETTVTPFAGG